MGSLNRASKRLGQSRYLSLLFNSSPLSNIYGGKSLELESRLICRRIALSLALFRSQPRQNSKENSRMDLTQYPPELIRNFSIIAHIDHGKSTLADRLFELAGTIKKGHGHPPYLDKLQALSQQNIWYSLVFIQWMDLIFEALNHAIERLTCNNASVSITKESSTALGLGFRCGFLGLLHMDVFHQRLEQEYGAHVISTVPTVPYIFEYSDGSKLQVENPAALPSNPKQRVTACWEPTVIATIIIPSQYVGPVITLCSERKGQQLEYSFIDSQRAFMKYRLPLREIVVDFYNELKSLTAGYASFHYEDADYQESHLVKLDILLNGQPVDAMATIVHKLKAYRVGRELVDKLKKVIDKQMFEITIQAAIGSKVIARETISAMRKNVLAKCYGGDVIRKRKLLEKQKEGKKRGIS